MSVAQPAAPTGRERFYPTPERLSQYLERSYQQVTTSLRSVEGRERLYRDLLRHEDDLRSRDPHFSASELRQQLDMVGETLNEKRSYLNNVDRAERARSSDSPSVLERVKNVITYPFRHPVKTLLVLAGAAGLVGLAYYFLGDLLLKYLPNYSGKAANVAKALVPGATEEMVLPGQGQFAFPQATPPLKAVEDAIQEAAPKVIPPLKSAPGNSPM